jgi:hypothetical protein
MHGQSKKIGFLATSIGRGVRMPSALVAPRLRVMLRSAAICNVLTVKVPILRQLYLILGIDRSRAPACNRVTNFISIQEEHTW